jgi:hypothetical protein
MAIIELIDTHAAASLLRQSIKIKNISIQAQATRCREELPDFRHQIVGKINRMGFDGVLEGQLGLPHIFTFVQQRIAAWVRTKRDEKIRASVANRQRNIL